MQSTTRGTRKRELKRRHLHKVQRHRQLLRTALVGLVAGCLAVFFQVAVAAAERSSSYLRGSTFAEFGLVCVSTALGAASAWVTGRFAPEAGGSGIPHIKAALMHLRTIRPLPLIAVKIAAGLGALA